MERPRYLHSTLVLSIAYPERKGIDAEVNAHHLQCRVASVIESLILLIEQRSPPVFDKVNDMAEGCWVCGRQKLDSMLLKRAIFTLHEGVGNLGEVLRCLCRYQ